MPLSGLFDCAGLLRNKRAAGMELQSEGREGGTEIEGEAHF
jgi:hypothetical protein